LAAVDVASQFASDVAVAKALMIEASKAERATRVINPRESS